MYKYSKFIFSFFAFVLLFPLKVVYEQNIEAWAKTHEYDALFSKDVLGLSEGILGISLIVVFLFLIGGSFSLWIDHFIRKNTTVTIPKVRKIKRTERNKTFRNQDVPLDGIGYEKCEFENVTLIFNGGALELRDNIFGGFIIKSDVPEMNSFIHLLDQLGFLNVPVHTNGVETKNTNTTIKTE